MGLLSSWCAEFKYHQYYWMNFVIIDHIALAKQGDDAISSIRPSICLCAFPSSLPMSTGSAHLYHTTHPQQRRGSAALFPHTEAMQKKLEISPL